MRSRRRALLLNGGLALGSLTGLLNYSEADSNNDFTFSSSTNIERWKRRAGTVDFVNTAVVADQPSFDAANRSVIFPTNGRRMFYDTDIGQPLTSHALGYCCTTSSIVNSAVFMTFSSNGTTQNANGRSAMNSGGTALTWAREQSGGFPSIIENATHPLVGKYAVLHNFVSASVLDTWYYNGVTATKTTTIDPNDTILTTSANRVIFGARQTTFTDAPTTTQLHNWVHTNVSMSDTLIPQVLKALYDNA